MNSAIPFLAGTAFGALAAAFIILVFMQALKQFPNDNEE